MWEWQLLEGDLEFRGGELDLRGEDGKWVLRGG